MYTVYLHIILRVPCHAIDRSVRHVVLTSLAPQQRDELHQSAPLFRRKFGRRQRGLPPASLNRHFTPLSLYVHRSSLCLTQVRYIAPVFPWNDPKFARPPVSSLEVPKASACGQHCHARRARCK